MPFLRIASFPGKLLFAGVLCVLFSPVIFAQDSYKLWYTQPAEKWTDALPLGNGRLGAMVFGGINKEHIQFNEETLWTGEPRNYNRKDAYKYLPEIRQLLFAGKQKEAEELAEAHFMGLKSQEGDREKWLSQIKALKGLDGNPALPGYNDSKWSTFPVPTYEGWESAGLEGVDGALWFRTRVTIPKSWKNKRLVLDLNRIREQDFTYLNGKLVGSTTGLDPRKYVVAAGTVKPGTNVLAIQVINYYDKGGIAGYKDISRPISIYPEGEEDKAISLNGNWKFKVQNDEPPAVARYQADYQPFGDLFLNFQHTSEAREYRRELDLKTAVSRTSYSAGGVRFTREYFVSQPDQAIVIRLTADKPGMLNFDAVLNSPHKYSSTRRVDNNTLGLALKVRNGALRGESLVRVKAASGKVEVQNDKIRVKGGSDVVIYITAGTNYISYNDVSGDPLAACVQALSGLEKKSFEKVSADHLKEYQRYYGTFSIDLGKGENESLPTDQRLEKFASSDDPSLAALYVQYGRYLLISSSRPGTNPANLQGIWNDLLAPPWGSKYTTNINAEMNYWPAEVLNLSPMHQPLFKMIRELSETGRETAKEYYKASGWLVHHNTDIWRGTAPINASNHGIWVSGGGWLSQHLWEHYLFTQDKNFLKNTAYPIMKGAAEFFVDFLVKDPKTGWLISTPGNSPENGGLVAGPTMDHQIIRTLFSNCIRAAKELGVDDSFRRTLTEKRQQIAPNQIGKYGQLQEWLEDKDDTTNKHRHVSHLWGVHPGNDITWDADSVLMKAARQSLIYRGDEGTGWSLAWKINFWARFKDGEHAMHMIKMLLRPATKGGGCYVNLFDAHPPFQIDGNFGGAAGIAEMLIQSHAGYLDLLPALPPEFRNGSVRGIKARGGFELNIKWKDGGLSDVEVISTAGNPCEIRYRGKAIRFSTSKGNTYKLNGDLKKL